MQDRINLSIAILHKAELNARKGRIGKTEEFARRSLELARTCGATGQEQSALKVPKNLQACIKN